MSIAKPKGNQSCARWGCKKPATYDKPLCYAHWKEWDRWHLEECTRCHWFYNDMERAAFETFEGWKEFTDMCDDCLWLTLIEAGRGKEVLNSKPDKRPTAPHVAMKRILTTVYVLKLSNGAFYVGQTVNLTVRMQEHREGLQPQTRGKNPRLVLFIPFEGVREDATWEENNLTRLVQSPEGRRRLRERIEEFQAPLRLMDLTP